MIYSFAEFIFSQANLLSRKRQGREERQEREFTLQCSFPRELQQCERCHFAVGILALILEMAQVCHPDWVTLSLTGTVCP